MLNSQSLFTKVNILETLNEFGLLYNLKYNIGGKLENQVYFHNDLHLQNSLKFFLRGWG